MSPKTCQVWSRNRGARFAISREVSQRSGGPLSLPHSARSRAHGIARRNCNERRHAVLTTPSPEQPCYRQRWRSPSLTG